MQVLKIRIIQVLKVMRIEAKIKKNADTDRRKAP